MIRGHSFAAPTAGDRLSLCSLASTAFVLVVLFLALAPRVHAQEPSYPYTDLKKDPAGKQHFVRLPSGKEIRYLDPSQLRVIEPPASLVPRIETYLRRAALPAAVDLRPFQTPVRDQGWVGLCYDFALVGAVEAEYKRRCVQNPTIVSSEAYCAALLNSVPPQELLLSVEHLNRDLGSRTSTRNPNASHENMGPCGALDDSIYSDAEVGWRNDGPILATLQGIRLATEQDAPYRIADGRWFDNFASASTLGDPLNLCEAQSALSKQERYDNYNYDPEYVPYNAGYSAAYAIRELVLLPRGHAVKPAALEYYLAKERRPIAIALSWSGITCNVTANSDGSFGCSFNSATPADQSVAGGGGHWMLLVGYDRPGQRFLLKNSWGGTLPYVWVPYDVARQRFQSGYIVRHVTPATASQVQLHEGGYLGAWHVFSRTGTYRGRLVIHRTRAIPRKLWGPSGAIQEDPSLKWWDRVGTFYAVDGQRHWVAGMLNQGNFLRLRIGGLTGAGGDAAGTQYNGGEPWGTMVLQSPDKARDGLAQTAVRDFYSRAQSNWNGLWVLTVGRTGFPGRLELGKLELQAFERVPLMSGEYGATGRFWDSTGSQTRSISFIDERGGHARVEFDCLAIAQGSRCLLDARSDPISFKFTGTLTVKPTATGQQWTVEGSRPTPD